MKDRPEKVSDDQRPYKCSNNIGFTASGPKSIKISGSTSIKKALVLQYRAQKLLKKHWFYITGLNKYQKSIGFTVSGPESVKKALVLQDRARKVSKKHWFYRLGTRKRSKSIGFIDRAPENVQKALVL